MAVAHGVHPDHLRVTEGRPSRGYRVAVLVGYGVVAALLLVWIYLNFAGA